MLSKVFRWKPGQLARNSSVLLGWMLLRAGAQAVTVVLLARILGAESYGAFVASIAVASFIIPLAGLGLSHILLRNGSRDPDHLPYYFRRAMHVWWITLIPAVALIFLLAYYLLPSGLPMTAVLAAMISELTAASMTELKARQQQAMQRINMYGAINAGLPLCRILIIGLIFLFYNNIDLELLLWIYCAASMLYVLYLMFFTDTRSLHTAPVTIPKESMPLHAGLAFTASTLAMRLQGEFNKPMLAQVGYSLTGNYNIAQRVVEMATLPLQAIQESLWPRLYAQPNPLLQLKRTGLLMLVASIILGFLLWFCAPLIVWLVGNDYNDTVEIIRLTAWLPILQLLRAILNFHLIYNDRIALIGWSSAVGAASGIISVLVLVPIYGIHGAVISSYASELTMILCLIYFVKFSKKGRTNCVFL